MDWVWGGLFVAGILLLILGVAYLGRGGGGGGSGSGYNGVDSDGGGW